MKTTQILSIGFLTLILTACGSVDEWFGKKSPNYDYSSPSYPYSGGSSGSGDDKASCNNRKVAKATGSTCNSQQSDPTKVIVAIKRSYAKGESLRIIFGEIPKDKIEIVELAYQDKDWPHDKKTLSCTSIGEDSDYPLNAAFACELKTKWNSELSKYHYFTSIRITDKSCGASFQYEVDPALSTCKSWDARDVKLGKSTVPSIYPNLESSL